MLKLAGSIKRSLPHRQARKGVVFAPKPFQNFRESELRWPLALAEVAWNAPPTSLLARRWKLHGLFDSLALDQCVDSVGGNVL